MDSPSPQQAHDTPHAAPASSDAAAQRPDTPLVHSMQIDDNSDLSIRHDGFIGRNCAVDNTNSLTDVTFPVISSADYETYAKLSGMFLYLHDGTLSGNVKKDKPILIMEDKYIIDEYGLLFLYRVDIPRQKTLASLKPLTDPRYKGPLPVGPVGMSIDSRPRTTTTSASYVVEFLPLRPSRSLLVQVITRHQTEHRTSIAA